MRVDFNRQEITERFEMLEKALANCSLPSSNGQHRQAKPEEFMLMYENNSGVHFKHQISRDYIMVKYHFGHNAYLAFYKMGTSFPKN